LREGIRTREAPLSETDPIAFPGRSRSDPAAAAQPEARTEPFRVSFNRQELSLILNVYGRRVAAGEWRDYAIDALSDRAVFSIFRKSSEGPLYRVVKSPRLARRQGAYAVIAPTGLVLRRGQDLGNVLRVIDKRLRLVEAV
jgi:hypothetical protein